MPGGLPCSQQFSGEGATPQKEMAVQDTQAEGTWDSLRKETLTLNTTCEQQMPKSPRWQMPRGQRSKWNPSLYTPSVALRPRDLA